jgi:hyperosmotically inducible protein
VNAKIHNVRFIPRTPLPMKKTLVLMISVLGLIASGWSQISSREQERLTKEVRHKLVTLPYYNVFDNLAFSLDGANVTLLGQTMRPSTKSDAEKAVKRIEGVGTVTNDIEVLPVSPDDDRLRRAVYKAIFRKPGLDMYAHQSVPSIHIIVKNGHVTLVGSVSNQGDKDQAGIVAQGVRGVFSVKNDLVIDKT